MTSVSQTRFEQLVNDYKLVLNSVIQYREKNLLHTKSHRTNIKSTIKLIREGYKREFMLKLCRVKYYLCSFVLCFIDVNLVSFYKNDCY